tara:strand:- start:265 stop:684 length:420 start_codon:yes stop_codon:yes gene_type:complete
MNKNEVIKVLSQIFNHEINGVVRYTHYALMVFGSDRLPLVEYFRAQAKESLTHADLAGEHITGLGGHPPLNNDDLEETFNHDINDLLRETLEHEKGAIKIYYKLLDLVKDKSVYLEEYARSMIGQEELHSLEVQKMLKD